MNVKNKNNWVTRRKFDKNLHDENFSEDSQPNQSHETLRDENLEKTVKQSLFFISSKVILIFNKWFANKTFFQK